MRLHAVASDPSLSNRYGNWGHSVYPDGLTIGFEPWSSDARTLKKDTWLQWFDARKIPGPRQQVEEEEARGKADRTNEERWMNAMPASLRPIWPGVVERMMPEQDPDAKILEPELAKEFPEPNKRILALISWYGSGVGPWSGYPMYEGVPEEMLLEYTTPELLRAIQSTQLSDQETEGAARLFGGWEFNQKRPQDNGLIPPELKQMLLKHCLSSKDQDKLARARKTFGSM